MDVAQDARIKRELPSNEKKENPVTMKKIFIDCSKLMVSILKCWRGFSLLVIVTYIEVIQSIVLQMILII